MANLMLITIVVIPSPDLIRINAAADDTGIVYVDGNVVFNITAVRKLFRGAVSNTSKMIAVDVFSSVGDIGLMVYISTGIVSDTSWKCTSGVVSRNWISPDFNDKKWPVAISYFVNSGSKELYHGTLVKMNNFPASAHWIRASEEHGSRMHCRRSLV